MSTFILDFFYFLNAKKNILKSNDFGVMQTVFFAFTCKFGLCLHVEKVVICINKTNWHPHKWCLICLSELWHLTKNQNIESQISLFNWSIKNKSRFPLCHRRPHLLHFSSKLETPIHWINMNKHAFGKQFWGLWLVSCH